MVVAQPVSATVPPSVTSKTILEKRISGDRPIDCSPIFGLVLIHLVYSGLFDQTQPNCTKANAKKNYQQPVLGNWIGEKEDSKQCNDDERQRYR